MNAATGPNRKIIKRLYMNVSARDYFGPASTAHSQLDPLSIRLKQIVEKRTPIGSFPAMATIFCPILDQFPIMELPFPLFRGVLRRRYKRFLADVTLDTGEDVTAHCPNSGSMLSVDAPGSPVWLSMASNPKRKLRYTWELIRLGSTMVGINTNRPNAIAADAIAKGQIPELMGYSTIRREVRYGRNSRIDLLLEDSDRPRCLVEVKNVTLRRDLTNGSSLEFPDAVTARGAKHLDELAEAHAQGARSVMLFLAQRNDSRTFRIANDIDPVYAETLGRAMEAGVEVVCYSCRISSKRIELADSLQLML